MKVLVVGSGAREHALTWKISQTPEAELFCTPGNPGTAKLAQNLPARLDNPAEVVSLARSLKADLVVVGPEQPLVNGLADALQAQGVPVFGPSAAAAAIEGSKSFAKEVMFSAGVPTAGFRVFDSASAAEDFAVREQRVVIKADGLAAGKGVVVANNPEEAVAGIRQLRNMGAAAHRLVLEEMLEGEEVSVMALCDGERYLLLPPVQDHKRVGEGDVGPNTGGMGAYSPTPFLADPSLERVGRDFIAPVLRELQRRGSPFRGALYAGLILTGSGPKVLEFNCRFGDPEAQVLMMQIDHDLLPFLQGCAEGKLPPFRIGIRQGTAVGVVLAAEGYPQSARTGDEIHGLESAASTAQIFHAGTVLKDNKLLTSGGRVLTVCGSGGNLVEARAAAYKAAAQVEFRGMHYRRDIGFKALSPASAAPNASAKAQADSR
jgi:phosphoribosylamine--glycine ligase